MKMKRRNEILDIHLDGPMKTTLKSNRSRIPRHIFRFIRHRCLSNNFYKVTKQRGGKTIWKKTPFSNRVEDSRINYTDWNEVRASLSTALSSPLKRS